MIQSIMFALAVQTLAAAQSDVPSLAETLREFSDPCKGVVADRSTWGPFGHPDGCRVGWKASAPMLGHYASTDPKNRKKALDPLLAALRQTRSTLKREAAIEGLIFMDPPAPEAVPLLLQAVASQKGDVAVLASQALVEYGTPMLAELKRRYFAGERMYFGVIARFGEPALPVLMEMMEKESDVSVRAMIASTLQQFGPKAVVALPYLKEILKSPRAGDRLGALNVIGAIGAPAASVVPDLVSLMASTSSDGSSSEAQWYATALGRIGPPAAVALPELRRRATLAHVGSAFHHAIAKIEGK